MSLSSFAAAGRLLLASSLSFCLGPAWAQIPGDSTATDSTAESSATMPTATPCGPMQPAARCVDFDASRSVDPGAGNLEYRWRMGDGTTLTGLKVSHCYRVRARYKVVLDVAVLGTDEVRRAERTFIVDLASRPVLNFSVNDANVTTARVGETLTFDALDSALPACREGAVLWDFRDGFLAEGRRVTHAFRKPGRFAVRMSMRGYGLGGCSGSHCVSQEIVVTP